MIIDAHTHIAKIGVVGKREYGFSDTIKFLLKEMKANSVHSALVMPWISNQNWWDPTLEQVLEVARPHKNIKIIGALDALKYTRPQLYRLDSLLASGEIRGVKIYTGYQHVYPSDERLEPVYAMCVKHDAPVIFHSGDTYAPQAVSKVKYSQPLQIDEVAADHKDLKIIVAHLGNPWTVDTAELLYKNPNVYSDISGFFAGKIDLKGGDAKLAKKRIREVVDYATAGKLVYGTDWPLMTMKDYLSFVRGLGLPKAQLDAVMYKNAATLFKIKI